MANQNLFQKIISKHLVEGDMKPGNMITIRTDQVLLQDATGTMAWQQFESLGVQGVKPETVVQYIDHNTLQVGLENPDDHAYLKSCTRKFGAKLSKPGNGICHQVHYERFGYPTETLIGCDSHTPTCGGLGMVAIGAGGLDIAIAMANGEYYFEMPKVFKIELTGELDDWCTAKDVILEILRRLSVKGGKGYAIEYTGDGVKSLSIPERCTICNMGAELGATTSIFPIDETTMDFLEQQERPFDENLLDLKADEDAEYDEEMTINLAEIEPMIACPHSPGNVKKVSEITAQGIKVNQVCIGSCTNSSYEDLARVATILSARKVHDDVELVINCGSKQVMMALAEENLLEELISAGARISECTCGACIGSGHSPASNAVSLRTFNRNFKGRSGTKSAEVYLCSPEVAVMSAITGEISDPRDYNIDYPILSEIDFDINDDMILEPKFDGEIVRGPNIIPLESESALKDSYKDLKVLIVTNDEVTTDDISPAGAEILKFRSNLPEISKFGFSRYEKAKKSSHNVDEGLNFYERAKKYDGGVIIGGETYGQGSSREHAALIPRYLGVTAVIAKSFARIHRDNLVNQGIIPLTFVDSGDYDDIDQGDAVSFDNLIESIRSNNEIKVSVAKEDEAGNKMSVSIRLNLDLSDREREWIIAGGRLNYEKMKMEEENNA